MGCPTLAELPASPAGKTGWPWTEESPQLADTMPDGKAWPTVSIVTPSYNQGHFIEETIRSVLLQGYPNLEYIIVDGASSDGSVDIIRKYADRLSYWVSEPDQGQAHAINKGWQIAEGEVVAWLNSDDTYTASAVKAAVCFLQESPHAGMVAGAIDIVDRNGNFLRYEHSVPLDAPAALRFRGGWRIQQPAVFIRRSVLDDVGMLDEGLYYLMDCDLWTRIALNYEIIYSQVILANFRSWDQSKTGCPDRKRLRREQAIIRRKYLGPVRYSMYASWASARNTGGRILRQLGIKRG